MSENDKMNEIIKRPGDQLNRPSGTGSSLASRGLALLNQGKAKGIDNAPPAPSPVYKVGDTKTIVLPGGVEMVFCYIPAGEFWMGSPEDEEDRYDDESLHRVVLTEPFWLGKYQVTQAQWEAVLGSCPDEEGWGFPGFNNPAENISWHDCQEFIQKLNAKGDGNTYALPTEAQWEYACRAGTTTPFSFGATITPEQVNYDGNYPYGNAAEGLWRVKTIPVGSLNSPNKWGLHDMHGNVFEWCADWYDGNYYENSPTNDPKGPESGESRVLRGGSWNFFASNCRSADRDGSSPALRSIDVGFRVVVHSSKT